MAHTQTRENTTRAKMRNEKKRKGKKEKENKRKRNKTRQKERETYTFYVDGGARSGIRAKVPHEEKGPEVRRFRGGAKATGDAGQSSDGVSRKKGHDLKKGVVDELGQPRSCRPNRNNERE